MYMKAILRGCLFCIVSRGLVRSLYRKLDAVPKPKGWGTPQSGLGLFLFLIGLSQGVQDVNLNIFSYKKKRLGLHSKKLKTRSCLF